MLKSRIADHNSFGSITTAPTDHLLEFDHGFDFQNTEILEYAKNTKKLEFKEILHIARNKDSVNKRSDINKLSRIYRGLLDL